MYYLNATIQKLVQSIAKSDDFYKLQRYSKIYNNSVSDIAASWVADEPRGSKLKIEESS